MSKKNTAYTAVYGFENDGRDETFVVTDASGAAILGNPNATGEQGRGDTPTEALADAIAAHDWRAEIASGSPSRTWDEHVAAAQSKIK